MSEWLELAKALIDAGGWTVVIAMVILGGVGLWRGWWVLRPWHKPIADENVELRTAVMKLTIALERERRRTRRTDA